MGPKLKSGQVMGPFFFFLTRGRTKFRKLQLQIIGDKACNYCVFTGKSVGCVAMEESVDKLVLIDR